MTNRSGRSFKTRYFAELALREDVVKEIIRRARKETITLVFASREEQYNNAAALKEYLGRR